jgi:hypothetical protein
MLIHLPTNNSTCYFIFWYLTKKKSNTERMLAQDFINIEPEWENEWYRQMDDTRVAYDNNRSKNQYETRYFYHKVISFDPKDDIDLETMQIVVNEWAMEFFSEHEVAIVYQNDNENHIMHAHVIANNTNLVTGNRFPDTKDMPRKMSRALQDIARYYGLRYFDNDRNDNVSSLHLKDETQYGFAPISLVHEPDKSTKARHRRKDDEPKTLQEEYLTFAERQMRRNDDYCWKDDIRARMDIALANSYNTAQFLDACESLDLAVRRTSSGDDYLFVHPENENWKCSGNRLGYKYTPKGLAEFFAKRARHMRKPAQAKNVSVMSAEAEINNEKFKTYLHGFRATPNSCILFVRPGSDVTLQDTAKALKFVREYRVRSMADFNTLLKRFDHIPETASVISKMRSIAYDSGMVAASPPKTKAPYEFPKDLSSMSNHELAKTIRDAYREAGFNSGSEKKAGKSRKDKTTTETKRRRQAQRTKTRKNK